MIHVSIVSAESPQRYSFPRDIVVVGRAPDADLVLDRPGVAKRHIRIALRGRVLVIDDLQRGNRLPQVVRPGDIIRVAGIDLRAVLDKLLPERIRDGVEQQLLDEIRQRPGDPDLRAVYADWLEQHGDAARAEFLRQQLAVGDAKAASDPGFVSAAARLAALAPEVGDAWRARVAMSFIEECPVPLHRSPDGTPPPVFGFELACPMRWDKLAPTDREDVRSCSGCNREVTYCTTVAQARFVAARGGCVAVDITTARERDDLEWPAPMVGMPSPRWRD